MAKKRSASSVRGKRRAKNGKHMLDSQINFSDIPEVTAEELSRAQRVGRPPTGKAKRLIALRVDPKLLAKLRRLAARKDMPYQTLMHELLEKALTKAA